MICAASPGSTAEPLTIDAREALARTTTGDLTIIDIRRPEEWQATGLPEGAVGATIRFGRGDGGFLARIREVTGGRKDAPIALICAQGVRSAYAASLLGRHGYTQVHDISEGMLGSQAGPGWLDRRLPVDSCETC